MLHNTNLLISVYASPKQHDMLTLRIQNRASQAYVQSTFPAPRCVTGFKFKMLTDHVNHTD